jgi:hypothetical protein
MVTKRKVIKPQSKSVDFSWSRISPGVTVINVPFTKSPEWAQSFLLCSDRHWDNPHSNWTMQKEHLDEARMRRAGVIENGDMFCAMQGKYDRRSDKSSVRAEHQYGDYLDRLVETAVDWWQPWKDLFILCGEGNHEASIKDRHETDLIQRFCALLNANGANVVSGGFGGFVRFRFAQSLNTGNLGMGQTVTLHYDHGYGGGGPVTHDAIQHQRRQVYLPDAEIIWSGHTHDSWTKIIARKRISAKDVVYHDEVLHLKTSTYKDDYGAGEGGWHARTGKPPKILGAYWLNFKWNSRKERIVFDVERAS